MTKTFSIQKTKLGEILFSLDPKDQKDFVNFARLSRFGLKEDCRTWLEEVVAQGPNWSEKSTRIENLTPSRRNAWAKDLVVVLRQFVLCFFTVADGYESRLMFRRKAAEFEWRIHQRAEATKLRNAFASEEQRDHSFHYYQWMFAEQQMIETKNLKDTKKYQAFTEQAVSAIEAAYLEAFLRIEIEGLNRNSIQNIPRMDPLLPVQIADLLQHPSTGVRAYAGIYRMLTEPNVADQAYEETTQLVRAYEKQWHPDFLKPLSIHLMNHCLRHCNKGNTAYAQAFLDWFHWREQRGILFEHQHLEYRTFRNGVQAALLLQDVQQAKMIIKKYSNYLPLEPSGLSSSSKEIAEAKILFLTRKYLVVRKKLNKILVPKMAFILQVDLYRLLIKANLELQDEDAVAHSIDAFRKYLERNDRIPPHSKNQLAAFLQACTYLNRADGVSTVPWTRLKEEVCPQAPLTDQPWLKKMIEERERH